MAEEPTERPTRQLAEEDVLAAVGRRIEAGGGVVDLRALGAVEVTWCSALDCRVVRSLRRRREVPAAARGRPDLSDRPVYYENVDDHPVPPPPTPETRQVWRLVRSGSVRRHDCYCDDGKVSCPRCRGNRRLPCARWTECAGCRERRTECCVACRGSGKRQRGRTPVQPSEEPVRRTACERCGAPDAACPDCRGQGHGDTTCPDCRGRGSVPCPECGGRGKVAHEACGGRGPRVSWTEGVIEDSPRRERVRLPGKRLPPLVRWRAARSGEWREATLGYDDPLPDDLAPEHRAAVEPRLAREPDEVARRADLRHLPLARVTVVTVPDQVFYVFPGRHGLQVVPVASRRRVGRIAASALAAAALCAFVLMFLLL